jgi:hypothetical protein
LCSSRAQIISIFANRKLHMSIFNYFKQLNLSQDQERALSKMESFLDSSIPIFMLKGYAGSGKTTIIRGLVEYLAANGKNFDIMAPTGRAAKVIREKTGQDAFTIHKSIYSFNEIEEIEDGNSFYYYYKIRSSQDVIDKIFIVDEASMLSDAKSEGEFFKFGTGRLLSDVVSYTRVAQSNVNSKIIFVGDPCQLPPVGDNSSKALDQIYLKEKFNLLSEEVEMKEVYRQGGNSGILKAAAKLRKAISAKYFNDFDLRSNKLDVLTPSYSSFLDTWQTSESPKIIIASKNRTCQLINSQIREKKFGDASKSIQKSDTVILGGNNYRKGVFNGEFAVISEASDVVTKRTIALKGKSPVTLTWRDVELVFPDSETGCKVVKGKMLENFLNGENYLSPEESQALYVDFTSRHSALKPKSDEFRDAIMKDDYFNCLLLKYGYAVTCHKAQGGEWNNVFVIWDNDNLEGFNCFVDKQRKAGKTNQDFYRWAYTAITRSSRTLYSLNPPFFNSYSTMSFIETPVLDALNTLSGNSNEEEFVTINDDLYKELDRFKLLDQPIIIQDHFIRVLQSVRKEYIEIVGWERIGYEIRFIFERERDRSVFRVYINGRNEFKNSFAVMPNLSQNKLFNEELDKHLSRLPRVIVKRNSPETIIQQMEFDLETEEKFPFTRNLFDDISSLLQDSDVLIEDLKHLQYKERYTFKRGSESTVIDFEYNQGGFFGRIVPIQTMTNSNSLLLSIYKQLLTFKVD